MLDVDALAQEIRRVDGNHSLGAGALAEALIPFLSCLSHPAQGWREMDSAPQDGTNILYRNKFRDIGFCHWDEGYNEDDLPCWWDNERDDEVCPMLWLPADVLPPLPTAPAGGSDA